MYQPDLSLIAEQSETSLLTSNLNVSPTKSIDSVISNISETQSLKRNILSGLNYRNYGNLEEESTIIEDESSFFEETKTLPNPPIIARNASKPIMTPHAHITIPTKKSIQTNSDEIKVAQKENYNVEDAMLRTLNADFNPSATKVKKRPFLKRGAGKNCLQPNAREMALAIQAKKEPKPGKRPQTAPAKNSIPPKTQTLIKPSTHKIQRAKTQNHPSKNVSKSLEFKKIETKKSLTKTVPARKTSNFQKPIEESVPSKSGIMNKEISAKKELFKKPYDEGLKTLAYRYFSQEAEDSINISIQNERQMNDQLEEIEELEAAEFDLMERLIAENSKLNLTDVCEYMMPKTDSGSSTPANRSSSTVIETLHRSLREAKSDDELNNGDADSFDPSKYEDVDSLYDSRVPISSNIPMIRKTAKITSEIEPDSSSIPSSITDSTDYDELPNSAHLGKNLGFNMDFSDAAPWDETLKNDSDDDNTEAPSFSTPAKPVSEATGFMKKVFGGQFQKSKNVENKKEEERIREREEIENLKRELENQKSELKRQSDRFKREGKALEDLRRKREREMEIFNLDITRREREFDDRTKILSNWEKEIGQKVKECKKIDALHRDVERSGSIRRKDFDDLKTDSAARERELLDKLNRLQAQNVRLKSDNDRLEKLQKDTRAENIKLNEQIDQITRNAQRKEGSTWREINKIVDAATQPSLPTKSVPPIRMKQKTVPAKKRESLNLSMSSINSGVMEPTIDAPSATVLESIEDEGKITQRLASGRIVTKFPNGTVKEISANGDTTVLRYQNGDVQQTLPDGKVVYYYSNNGATSSRFPNGKEVLEFPNGQKEILNPEGTREIIFPDGIRELTHISGKKETFYIDGSRKLVSVNGDEVLFFPDGQKETRTTAYRRREMPDGTTKTIFLDTNYTETRYSTGRVRIKDSTGKIIVDRNTA